MTEGFTNTLEVVIISDGHDRALALAERMAVKVIAEAPAFNKKALQADTQRFTLRWISEKLTLQDHSKKPTINICIDFTHGRALHRLKFGGGHGQELARAIKTRERPSVCDATAGLGKDAFVIASLGCEVVLLEQSSVVHALLEDGITRALTHPDTRKIAERMHLYHCNSTLLPEQWPHNALPQVVYLDPMYPDVKRTAKKEIQTLRALLDTRQADTTLEEIESETAKYEATLLNAARNTAKRVVVKRPRKAAPLAGVTPSGNINSPNTRYDIYGS